MTYIPKFKFGSCECGAVNVQGRKVGKTFYCRPCYTKNKTHEQIGKAIERDKRRTAATNAASKLSKLPPEAKAPKGYKSKSELLRDADRVFSDYIKARDIGVKSGTAYCPCCDKVFDSRGVDVNCMHFVDRDVYSLRFDEINAHIGHASCNRNQHYNPKGIEYQNFRNYLVKQIGEEEVIIMEIEHRKINKITEQQLKNIIEHYSQQN